MYTEMDDAPDVNVTVRQIDPPLHRNDSARLELSAEFVDVAKISSYVFDQLAPRI